MPRCAIKRGFLFLTECGAPATKLCETCGRPACDEHLVLKEGGTHWICVDCEGHAEVGAKGKARPLDPERPALWRHRYRDAYYRDHRYAPYYFGTYYDSYYDDYDLRAFDREVAAPGEPEEAGGGPDLMDS